MSDLRKLHEAATPGPWKVVSFRQPGSGKGTTASVCIVEDSEVRSTLKGAVPADQDTDAAFIAGWRNAAPLILDVLDAARKDNRGISWSKNVADALAALDAHLEASKPKP